MHFWVSCSKMTVRLTVNEKRIITETAPILHRFVGQPSKNLFDWLEEKFGHVTIKYLSNPYLTYQRKGDNTCRRSPKN